MRIAVGTSGYSYKEWKGHFYPEDLPASKMLAFYADHFDTVEINNSFYRMPEPKTLAKWAGTVPSGFQFVLKSPQLITHSRKLIGAEEDVSRLLEVSAALGETRGPLLFQLPPFLRKDAARLLSFTQVIPRESRIAFEFRHPSWFDEEIYQILRDRDAALCAADTDESKEPESLLVPTATWGYLRLRRTQYEPGALQHWASLVQEQKWDDAFVFFKHEDEAKGPAFANIFKAAIGSRPGLD